jgi:acyl-CoA-dependent ceramide synthase
VLLLPPLLALPTHSLLRPYFPPILQAVGNPFTPLFLLSHPAPAPERLSAAVVRPELAETTQLYLKSPGDLALLVYSVVLFSFLHLVRSHSLFPALARKWGIRKARKVARFGEQGYAVVYFLVVGVGGW